MFEMLTLHVENTTKEIPVAVLKKGLKDNIRVELLLQLLEKLQEVTERAELIEGKNLTFLGWAMV